MTHTFSVYSTTLRTLLSAILFLIASPGGIQAELLPIDDLSKEWEASKKAFKSGEDRLQIASRLRDTAARNPGSWWYEKSITLAENFETSAEKLALLRANGWTQDKAPWSWLAESKIQSAHLLNPESHRSTDRFLKEHPHDPATRILAEGRKLIPLLIPHFKDMSPSRSQEFVLELNSEFPRVCDTALHLVEYFSGCSFCEDTFSFGAFNSLDDSKRIRALNAAQRWWETSGHLPQEEGIKAQMPYAGMYGKIRMCEALLASDNEESRTFAQVELHRIADSENLAYTDRVGQILESYGDPFCRGVITRRLKKALSEGKTSYRPTPAISHIISYGDREDWEVLTQYARAQVAAQTVGGEGLILPAILASYCSRNDSASVYAIPAVALALERRFLIPILYRSNQARSYADLWNAMLQLQKHTGEPFGVTTDMPAPAEAERVLAHIEKWWRVEGQAKYTFDLIQQRAGQ